MTVTEEEIRATVRAAGLFTPEDAEAVVFETDGSFSVIKSVDQPNPAKLAGIDTPDQIGH